jgi:hypothetical protein
MFCSRQRYTSNHCRFGKTNGSILRLIPIRVFLKTSNTTDWLFERCRTARAAFSLHLIKSGRIPLQYGKSLRQADQIRLIADYSDEEVDSETAVSAIEQANHFVEAIGRFLKDVMR